ncbi:MAG: hypothetical protein K2H86_05235 [Muribaculaceae bacterium]|nr:hypothetical protein [Muribaculaceae bacterium]
MELHQTLKHIIRTEGNDIVTDLRLVNMLNDLNAWQDIKGGKYILRAIINDGFAQKFLHIGRWNNDAINLASGFASTTGFKPDLVELLFKSLAYGFGWIKEWENISAKPISVQTSTLQRSGSNVSRTNTSINKQSTKKSIKAVEKMNDDEFETFIWSKIEWDHIIEDIAGVSFKNYHITPFNCYTGFRIQFEIEGRIKTVHLNITYIAFDSNGRICAYGTGFYMTKESKDRIGEINVFFNKDLDKLGSVVFDGSYCFS